MNRNAHGTWLQAEHSEAEKDHEPVIIKLPDETPDWDDSTIYIQRIHNALLANGWGRGPI